VISWAPRQEQQVEASERQVHKHNLATGQLIVLPTCISLSAAERQSQTAWEHGKSRYQL